MSAVLQIENLSRSYRRPTGAVTALREVSLSVRPGEFVCVQGPSGCGKTTLLLSAGALLRPDDGTVRVDGQDPYILSADAAAALRAEKIGFVFQQFHLVPYLDVLGNVLAASLSHPAPDARARAMELIGRVGLEDRAEHVPAELSTGQRQRTALARAMLNRPKLLLADEPTGNLDETSAQAVLTVLSEFAEEGAAVLLVTHDAKAAAFADRIMQMDRGRLAPAHRDAAASSISSSPQT